MNDHWLGIVIFGSIAVSCVICIIVIKVIEKLTLNDNSSMRLRR
jgi:hypothetical protein